MDVQAIRSDATYRAMMEAPVEKRNDLYRYEIMKPFKQKWDCYHIPLKAAQPGGYDVIMASEMLGILAPTLVDASKAEAVRLLSSDAFWDTCQNAVERSLACFTEHGISLPVQSYRFTALLANPENPTVQASEGYSGDGGIPGYIFAWLNPNERTIARMPAALAHETNHNIRFQFIEWSNDITLGEMMVSEGLAENFATHMFGEEQAGPWVSNTAPDVLNHQIKPAIHKALDVQGMAALSAYLYGDETAALQGYPTVGMPYCAGYACGYHLVKHFLAETGTSIVDATLMPAASILDAAQGFWG